MVGASRKPSFNPIDLLFMNSAKYESWNQWKFPYWRRGREVSQGKIEEGESSYYKSKDSKYLFDSEDLGWIMVNDMDSFLLVFSPKGFENTASMRRFLMNIQGS